jgi:hypothetical protein
MDIDGVVKGLMSDKVIGVILESVFKIKVPGKTGRPRKTTFKDQIATGVVGGKLGLAALAVYALREKGVCSMEQGMAVVASVAERLDRIDIIDCFPSAKNWVVRDALARMGVDLTTDLTIEEMGSAAANVLKLYVEGQALMMASKAQQGVRQKRSMYLT